MAQIKYHRNVLDYLGIEDIVLLYIEFIWIISKVGDRLHINNVGYILNNQKAKNIAIRLCPYSNKELLVTLFSLCSIYVDCIQTFYVDIC